MVVIKSPRSMVVRNSSIFLQHEKASSVITNAIKLTDMFTQYSVPLHKFCSYKLSSNEKSVDVVADTFARTWKYLVGGNSIENEKSFLYTTARNLIIDEYRKKKSSSLDLLMESGFEATNEYESDYSLAYDNRIIAEELQKLPEKYSSIMLMRYVSDYSVGEISKQTNTTENNVSVKLHRGKALLRKVVLMQHLAYS